MNIYMNHDLKNLENEIWKPVKGYEEFYLVSNLGRIKSIGKYRNHKKHGKFWVKERILKSELNTSGYPMVGLSINSNTKYFVVHRIVAIAFIENINDFPVINHKNGVKTDNNINNLEWCSISYNNSHAFRMGLSKPNKPSLGKFGKLNHRSKPINQFDKAGRFIQSFECIREAARKLNISCSPISGYLNGRNKNGFGFIWKYKN